MITRQEISANCFVCGSENKKGLGLKWFTDYSNETVFSDAVISEEYCGYEGIVHGGIVAAVLDEAAGRTIFLSNEVSDNEDIIFVTKQMEIKYVRPTPVNTPLHAVGRLEARDGRYCSVGAKISLPDGTLLAQARAVIVLNPKNLQLVKKVVKE
jgi:Uncharacterized protein, possibly involved in aromatic compounds catabolism